MTPNKLDLDRIEGLAGRLRSIAGVVEMLELNAAKSPAETVATIRESASDLTALISYARELEADKARLDFLDRLNVSLNKHYGTDYRWSLITNHNVNRLMLGGHLVVDLNDAEANGLPSCRDAIDARMKESDAALSRTQK